MSVSFSSTDERFRVELSKEALGVMHEEAVKSYPNETGGIVIGHYTRSRTTALVERATPPTPDSRGGRTSFYRGVRGLQKLLQRLWRRPTEERRYYLGEWHFHPGANPAPSASDIGQMKRISQSDDYQCPEPILVILGGRPPQEYDLEIWVFRRGSNPLKLGKAQAAVPRCV